RLSRSRDDCDVRRPDRLRSALMPRVVLVVVLVLAAACDRSAAATHALRALDADAYTSEIHPLVEAKCASLDCHGAPGRPLRVYSEIGLRIRDDLRPDPGQMAPPVTAD